MIKNRNLSHLRYKHLRLGFCREIVAIVMGLMRFFDSLRGRQNFVKDERNAMADALAGTEP